MDETGFRGWLSGLDVLTTEQRLEVLAILSGRPSREDVAASVEGGRTGCAGCIAADAGERSTH